MTFPRQRLKKVIINNLQHLLRNLLYFNQTASAIHGVIQLINQHQEQISRLNNIKQACLSKMFV